MSGGYSYAGRELDLFKRARNWKKYFSAQIRPYLKGRIAEAGAGTGNTTPYLHQGSDIVSWMLVEPDGEFCRILRAAIADEVLPPNCHVVHGDIHSLAQDMRFDAIVYIDVLEHIERDREEISAAVDHLNPNGHLIILSPAHQSLYSPFDKAIGHKRRYNKRSLIQVVDAKQMEKVKLRYLDSAGSILSWANSRLAKQSYPTKDQIAFWDALLVPLSRIIDRLVFYTFGRSILGIWKKHESTG